MLSVLHLTTLVRTECCIDWGKLMNGKVVVHTQQMFLRVLHLVFTAFGEMIYIITDCPKLY